MRDDLASLKAAMRRASAEARAGAHRKVQGRATEHMLGALGAARPNVLAGYIPMRTEIDALPAMSAHAGPVCVPVIIGPAQPLGFRTWSPAAQMVAGPFGAAVPAEGDWLLPDVLIVPLLAFDRRGFRLGYGGGFYDRTLQQLRAKGPVIAIGFAFAAQEVPEVPIEPTDQRLDMIITEEGPITP